MTNLNLNTSSGAITVTVTAEPGGKKSKFTIDAAFGSPYERFAQGLAKATGEEFLLLTARKGAERLPVKMPVFAVLRTGDVGSDMLQQMESMFNTVVENGWEPVFEVPSGRACWTVEAETTSSTRPDQEVGKVIHAGGASTRPAFRKAF